MSFPNIPNVTPTISLTREEVVNLLRASIAFEELGLAHVINAEAEKLQAVIGTIPGVSIPGTSLSSLLSINQSVNRTLQTALKTQMLLQFKLEDVNNIRTESTTSTSSTTSTTSSTTSTTTSTTSTTSTTTSTTSTTTTTTPPILIFQNTATASGTFDGIPRTAVIDAFYNSTVDPNVMNYDVKSPPVVSPGAPSDIVVGGINLGELPNYLFYFADGSTDANWQGATKGFIGDVAVNGVVAAERTSGSVPYAGTIFTNDATLGAWQNIVNQNPTQASASTNEVTLINNLTVDLNNAFAQINALPASPGFASVSSTSLDGLNTLNGMNETFVINVTSDFTVSSPINITGDPGDVYILRWDTDANPLNGYQGIVKFQSGGAIIPNGGLKPTNFIHVAGDINSSGGGSTPAVPYPQGPRTNSGTGSLITGGSDFSGGGFFTGYWLTTGDPNNGETQPLSNGIFVGGWYTLTNKFSMTSGTSGVYVTPPSTSNFEVLMDIVKEISVDGGVTFLPADVSPGPVLPPGGKPWFRITVTNTGTTQISNVLVTDNVIGFIGTIPVLDPGESYAFTIEGM